MTWIVFPGRTGGSEEERADVVAAYAKFHGDMGKVFMWVMCSDEAKDAHRFADAVDAAVADGSAPCTKRSKTGRGAFARNPRRRIPAEPRKTANTKKKGKDDDSGLAALILARRETRADDLFASLEAKYGGAKKKKPKPEKKPSGAPKAAGGVAKKKK